MRHITEPGASVPDDLVTGQVAAQILSIPIRQVPRMVERKELTPYAYVSTSQRRLMIFRRSYVEEKKKLLDSARAARDALRED